MGYQEKLGVFELERKIMNFQLSHLDSFSLGVMMFVVIMQTLPFGKAVK